MFGRSAEISGRLAPNQQFRQIFGDSGNFSRKTRVLSDTTKP